MIGNSRVEHYMTALGDYLRTVESLDANHRARIYNLAYAAVDKAIYDYTEGLMSIANEKAKEIMETLKGANDER